ncbi:MAG: hypothetical protein RH942_12650 [Kiloniellaceae bacterium]
MAAFAICLLGQPAAVEAQNRPIEGHQNLKLGMTISEALAAEPRARRSNDCDQHGCLSYFDRRFLGTGFQVRADFGEADSLGSILMSVELAGGGAVRCADFYRNAVRDYTRAHGVPEDSSEAVATWQDAFAIITVTGGCTAGNDSTVQIAIDRRYR